MGFILITSRDNMDGSSPIQLNRDSCFCIVDIGQIWTASQTPCILAGQLRNNEAINQGNSRQLGTKPRIRWQPQQCWEDVALDQFVQSACPCLSVVESTYLSDRSELGMHFHIHPKKRASIVMFSKKPVFHHQKILHQSFVKRGSNKTHIVSACVSIVCQ